MHERDFGFRGESNELRIGKNESRGLGRQSPLQNFHFIVRSLIAYPDEELGPFRFHLDLVGVKGETLISDLVASINPPGVLKGSLASAGQLPLETSMVSAHQKCRCCLLLMYRINF